MQEKPNLTEIQLRITDATIALVSEHGYKGTTTKQIAQAAEVNESTLFKNFKTKQEIFLSAYGLHTAQLMEELDDFFSRDFVDALDFLEDTAVFTYSLFMKKRELVTILLRELGNRELGIGNNSIIEYVVRRMSRCLAAIYGADSPKAYNAPSFLFIGAIFFLLVDQRYGNTLTDELDQKVVLSDIPKMIYKALP